jgi:hypothetical protein
MKSINSMSNSQWLITCIVAGIVVCFGIILCCMLFSPPKQIKTSPVEQADFHKHKAIFTYDSKENEETWERTFEDTTYIRREYADNRLIHIAYGHWHINDSLNHCLKIVFDSATKFDTTWKRMVTDDEWVRNIPSFDLSFRNLKQESIEFLRESGSNMPAHWEVWHRVM